MSHHQWIQSGGPDEIGGDLSFMLEEGSLPMAQRSAEQGEGSQISQLRMGNEEDIMNGDCITSGTERNLPPINSFKRLQSPGLVQEPGITP